MHEIYDFEADVIIRCDSAVNLDSLPLRFGITFKPDFGFNGKKLRIFDIAGDPIESQPLNEKRLFAAFIDSIGKMHLGEFILTRRGKFPHSDFFKPVEGSQIFVKSIMPATDINSIHLEEQLSETLAQMRKNGEIIPEHLMALHSRYVKRGVCNKDDLIKNIQRLNSENVETNEGKYKWENPMTLEAVYAKTWPNKVGEEVNNIVLKFKGISTELRNNWSKGFEKRLEHCRSLIGKRVRVKTWKSYNSRVWFESISEYRPD